jgi:hypothetical protein
MSTQALYEKRPGWLTFAALVMFAIGGLRIISAITYFADSNKVNNLSGGLFGDQIWVWGLWDLGIAALALFAGYSLLGGNPFGRIVAYVWAVVTIIQAFLYIGFAPWYAAAAITLATLVIYGLAVASDYSESR